MDQSVYLKIKIKSLAAEARIIRKEEQKNTYFRIGLKDHRVGVVRIEARHSLLAYNFLRGVPYRKTEPVCRTPIDVGKVKAMVKKYGIQFEWVEGLTYKQSQDLYSEIKEKEAKALESWLNEK